MTSTLELDRFRRKIEAGARFAMTQVLFDRVRCGRSWTRLGGTAPVPLLVGLWPVTSHALALRLHNEVPGITIPDAVLDRFAAAEAQAAGRASPSPVTCWPRRASWSPAPTWWRRSVSRSGCSTCSRRTRAAGDSVESLC